MEMLSDGDEMFSLSAAASEKQQQTYPQYKEQFLCTKTATTGNKSAPTQLAQCRFPGLAISNAKILIYFSSKIYGSNFIKQELETVMV